MINVKSVKVNTPKMVLKEGVIANNNILSYEEFKEFMKPQLTEQVLNKINKNYLNEIRRSIKAGKLKEAYEKWEGFQRNILKNKNYAVSLLFIENINSTEGNYVFRYNLKEADILNDHGKLTRLSQLMQQLFKEEIEEQVQKHLNEFLNSVATSIVPKEEVNQIYSFSKSSLKLNASLARWHNKDYTYKNIFFGRNPSWRGNATDAFMNHMAHLHAQVIANDIDSLDIQNLFSESVFSEEKNNIFNLLRDAKNNTAWFTGGDIIFKYQGQLFNIQLKTGVETKKQRSRIGGKLATQTLLTLIDDLKQDIQTKDVDKLIQDMYNKLKTSGWVEDTNKAINEIASKTIENSFS